MEKVCKICGGRFDMAKFYTSTNNKDGYRDECIVCDGDIVRRHYYQNPEDKILQVLSWQFDNIEKVRAYRRKYKEKKRNERNERESQGR